MKNFMKWALIIVIINVVLGIVGLLAGHQIDPATGERDMMSNVTGWIGMISGIVCLFLGIKERCNASPQDFTFGRGWNEGFLISIVAAILLAIWTYILFGILDPEFIEELRTAQMNLAAKSMSQEQLDQARPMMEFFMSPTGFAISVILMYALGGMILSLIISPIVNAMKKPSPEPMQ